MKIAALRGRFLLALLAATTIGLTFDSNVSSQGRLSPRAVRSTIVDGREAVSGEVLVKFRSSASNEREQLERLLDADESEEIARNVGIRRIHSRVFSVDVLIAFLRTQKSVAYVEPNYILRTTAVPADPQFGSMWGLLNTGQGILGTAGTPGADIHATSAWSVSTGSRNTVVGVIDTGIDYSHQDLAANVWTAPTSFTVTVGGRTITCAAGTHGFNAITNSCDPMDDNNHGTHVSGTIGAVGNNGWGGAGVNWATSIMGSKFLDANGNGTLANAVNAIEFVIQAKAAFAATGRANVRVLSNSWGGGGYSQALLDEINKARDNDILFVAAAGNGTSNNDAWAFLPADYTAWGATNIIAVAATDNQDQLASFSNYGSTLVHLGAPGVNILSTVRGNQYRYFNGTSMATPHVSGAAALILSACTLATDALKTTILDNVDVVGGLMGWTATNGRLNVDKALRSCMPALPPPPPPAPTGLTATPGNTQVALAWTESAGATGYNVYRKNSDGTYLTLATGIAVNSYANTGLTNGITYVYQVAAVTNGVEGQWSAEVSSTPVAPPPVVPPPVAPTSLNARSGPAKGQISLQWHAAAGATSYSVKRSETNNGPYSIVASGASLTYVDGGLVRGRRYYYVVSATNASGQSANSKQANANAK